jgi:acyl-CoA synthetase (NDP forming)
VKGQTLQETTDGPRPPARAHRLDTLFNPRSVAIVGASERNHYSNLAMNALRMLGYDGALHLVNRRGGEAYGLPCAPDCRSLGAPVDAAYLSVPYEGLLDSVADAIEAGARNLIVLTSGLAEVGGEGARREAQLKAMCEAAGVRALGPNCLGFRNMLDRVGLGSIPFTPQATPGYVALVSASGSVANFVTAYGVQQGVDFTHVIATGNEMDVTTAEIVDYLVDIPEVQAITLFLEGIKRPDAFAAAAARALAARKPIVAVKAGAAPGTAAIAAAHTSAVVGDDRVFDAACERLGVIRVDAFEDLVTTAAAIAVTGPIRPTGVALVSMSGGMCEVASDLSARTGATLPALSEETRKELAGVLSELGQINNPLDLTGAAVRDESLWTSAPTILSRDPGVGLTLINWDLPAVAQPSMPNTLALIGEVHKATAGPALIVTNFERGLNEHGQAYLQRHGIRFALPGFAHAMTAAGKLAWWSERLERPPPAPRPAPAAPATRPRNERETLDHLAAHGVPVSPARVARSAAEAAEAARDIGGPVALKVLSADIAHKTEAGGIRLNVAGPEDARQAFDDILRTVGARAPDARLEGVLVAPMRTGGLEVLVGAARDPQWDLVLAVGLGGVWVEALGDTALCLLPAEPDEIAGKIRSLKAAKLFDGYRGAPAADIGKLAEAAARIGEAALALGPALTALEVNPLYVRGDQIEALDALATWAD